MYTNRWVASVALVLGLAVSVSAAADCTTKSVDPGVTFCLPSLSASTSVTATGSSDRQVTFTVTDFNGGALNTIFAQGDSTGFLQSWDSTNNPDLFPGVFTVCAKRTSGHGTPALVQLCISGS